MANLEWARNAFKAACDFHEVAVRCLHPKLGPLSDLPIPQTVVTAFAAELYMKSLIMRRLDPPKRWTHKLDELFNELDDVERETVTDEFEKQGYLAADQLPDQVRWFDNTFVEWRYLYEQPGNATLHSGALSAFTLALYRAVRTLEPSWPIHPDFDQRVTIKDQRKTVTFRPAPGQSMQDALFEALADFGLSQAGIAELKRQNFTPIPVSFPPELDDESAAVEPKVGGGSDSDNGSTG